MTSRNRDLDIFNDQWAEAEAEARAAMEENPFTCPECNSPHIEGCYIFGTQADGTDADLITFTCRSCGHNWGD